MARLNVKPTRMELSNLKDRLNLSTRGHKLLKDKQDELMRQFITLIKQNNELRDEVEEELTKAMQEFVIAKSLINEAFIEELFVGTETSVELNIHEKNIIMRNFQTKNKRHLLYKRKWILNRIVGKKVTKAMIG